MAIEFVVEDGTGKADATSYASTAEFQQYWENRGIDMSSETTANMQAWLNVATNYIDINYRFFGARTTPDTQALQWPRENVLDRDGNEIDDDVLPTDIKYATIELAKVVKDKGVAVSLYSDDSDRIQSQRLGPASVTYKSGVQLTLYKSTVQYLKPYLMGGTLLVNRI
jgi:hypothetical protein